MERAATRTRCPVASEVSGGVFGCVGNEENRPVARPAHMQALQLHHRERRLHDKNAFSVRVCGTARAHSPPRCAEKNNKSYFLLALILPPFAFFILPRFVSADN